MTNHNLVLRHFRAEEFGKWWELMSPHLLLGLDAFRDQWGAPVVVSPSREALGRHDGDGRSQHNVDRWGEVRAADVFARGLTGPRAAAKARRIAERVGFTGVGVYPQALPHAMLHLDWREGRTPSEPAEWTAVRNADGGWDYAAPELDQHAELYS